MQQHPDFGKNVPALQNKCPHCPARKSETALGHVVMILSINGKFPLLIYLFIYFKTLQHSGECLLHTSQ